MEATWFVVADRSVGALRGVDRMAVAPARRELAGALVLDEGVALMAVLVCQPEIIPDDLGGIRGLTRFVFVSN